MKRNILSRGMAMLLAMTLLLAGCAASSGTSDTTDAATTVPEKTTTALATDTSTASQETTAPKEETTAPKAEKQLTFFSMNLNQTTDANAHLLAYPNDDGSVYVEYVGEVKKVGTTMDAAVLYSIAAAMVQTQLSDLNGQSVYEESEGIGSVYAEYSDGSVLSASYTGAIPQEYIDAYETMDICFQDLTAELEIYVPTPVVNGEVDPEALAELTQILEVSGIENLDTLQISDVMMDDSFAYVMGLSSADGILRGTNCTAMMSVTPYSLVIATVENEKDLDAVQADFVNSLDWMKWVCVMPTDAMVAQKSNMVLCLMGSDDLYRQTADAVVSSGWGNIEETAFPGT